MISAPTPPFSLEAERAVLGSCILSSEALSAVIGFLKPDDFYDTNNRITYNVISGMYMREMPVDHLTLETELSAKGLFDRLGGRAYLLSLLGEVTTTANAGYHAEIVRERSIRRKLIDAGEQLKRMAVNFDKTIPMIFEDAEKLLFDARQNKSADEFRHVRDVIAPVLAGVIERQKSSGSHYTGYITGFTDLDEITGGLQPGSFNIIAARPSMGKTAFAINIAQFGGGQANSSVLIFSLEMPSEQLVQRMVSAESGVDLSRLNRGMFDTSEFAKVKEACNVLAKREIYINDATQLSALELRARCRRFKMRHPDLALIVIDYLQLMSSGERRSEGRQQEVSDISRMLKAIAREMNCPMIALSQLSREAEKRTDKKPQLADLRDSGAIEQDADVVMMMYRQDYYGENEKNDLTNSEAEIRIAKNRNGSTGVVKLTFEREITRFRNHGELPPE